MNKQQKIKIGIIAVVLVLVVVIVAVAIVTVGGSTKPYDSHMELAQQYLDDLQYEQAIAEYKAAIEIEPKNGEAYLALADIYVQQGNYEAAINVLNQGLGQIEDERLEVCLQKLEEEYAEVQQKKQLEQVENAGSEIDENIDDNKQEVFYYTSGAIWLIYEYGENGNLVKETLYDETGEITSIREYDENGNLVKYGLDVVYWTVFEYAENEKLVKETSFYDNEMPKLMREYDSNANLVKETYYYEDGTISQIDEYDSDGNHTKFIRYNTDGTINGHWWTREGNKTTDYNADGTIYQYTIVEGSRGTIYNADGTIKGHVTYE